MEIKSITKTIEVSVENAEPVRTWTNNLMYPRTIEFRISSMGVVAKVTGRDTNSNLRAEVFGISGDLDQRSYRTPPEWMVELWGTVSSDPKVGI